MSSESAFAMSPACSTHKCGRCRLEFDLGEKPQQQADVHWWLCPPCRARLLGDKQAVDSKWA